MSNLNFIEQNVTKNLVPTKSGSRLECIKNLTHLYLHDKFIQKIGNLSACENLQVLYLHNNDIFKIANLEPLTALRHLYLQKNKISKIEGFDTLKRLKKLYLGYNEISVVEGLDKLINLEELHVEAQRLHKADSLCFDPRSIVNLAESLQTLNISHGNITTLNSLEPLKRLKNLNASYNKLTDVQEVAKVVQNWFHLTELNFIGNPMAKQHRYRDTLIANTLRLVLLDNKDINETTRSFIKRFQFEKSQNRMNSTCSKPKKLAASVAVPQLERAVSKAVVKSLSSSVLTTTLNEETAEAYIPWNALKLSVNDTGSKIPPLFASQKRPKKLETTKKVQFMLFPQISH